MSYRYAIDDHLSYFPSLLECRNNLNTQVLWLTVYSGFVRLASSRLSTALIAEEEILQDNTWVTVTVVISSNMTTLFVNGVNVASGDVAIDMPNGDIQCSVGRALDPAFDGYNGAVDDVRFYHSLLSRDVL